jgi:glutathione synthase/RimK-type ligase-like ATP-grasp enzyme/aminoglycoside phosphotransferase (APT) family kinase protein
MRICLLTDKPDHPLLVEVVSLLGARHTIDVVDPETKEVDPGGPRLAATPADVYLLKSRTRDALSFARAVEHCGGQVVNGASATRACQDRSFVADRAHRADLPFPYTYSFARLSGLISYVSQPGTLRFPLIVKSRWSRRGDLVARVNGLAQLEALNANWSREPVVVQTFIPNTGWDHKLWVVGSEVFAGLRPSPLESAASAATIELAPARLPAGWVDLARRVGEIFDLEVYGVDILATRRRPVIVDVNAFPGCRGVPGAPAALAALVEDILTKRADLLTQRRLTADEQEPGTNSAPTCDAAAPNRQNGVGPRAVPIAALHDAVRNLLSALDGADSTQAGAGARPTSLKPVYLRRKPGRGLVISYRVPPSALGDAAPGQRVTALLSERIIADPNSRQLLESADPAEFSGSWPGVVRCSRLGMLLQAFPADSNLPTLPLALCAAPGTILADVFAGSSRTATGRADTRVLSIQATPVRHKPGVRCVIRYDVHAVVPGKAATPEDQRALVFFGKLYRDAKDAVAAYRLAERLWDESPTAMLAYRPISKPLAVVRELGLVLTEAAGGAQAGDRVSGTHFLRPVSSLESGAAAPYIGPAREALVATASALAWLHTRDVRIGLRELSADATYADRVGKWTQALAGQLPDTSAELARICRRLTAAFAGATPGGSALVHGALKPSQLIICGPAHVVMTDFDAAGLGDPALDLGYFLAYLRPPGVWKGRADAHAWFAAAASAFLDAYVAALQKQDADMSWFEGVRGRTTLFEAALLLKIASRRTRRLNSPRPGEARSAVAEVESCLERVEAGR